MINKKILKQITKKFSPKDSIRINNKLKCFYNLTSTLETNTVYEIISTDNTNNILRKLTDIIVGSIFNKLKHGNKTIAFYNPYSFLMGQQGHLVEKLYGMQHNVLVFIPVTFQGNEHGYENYPYTYYTDEEILKKIDFVDAWIDYNTGLIPYVKGKYKIGIPHSIAYVPFDTKTNAKDYYYVRYAASRTFYNYYFCTCLPESIRRLKKPVKVETYKDKFPQEIFTHKSKNIYLIPAGYPKLDGLINKVSKLRKSLNNILVCPGTPQYKNDFDFDKMGAAIIEKLLKEFPEYNIIYRPHPAVKYTEEPKKYKEYFKNNKNFIVDMENSYINNYANAVLMITDRSGTANTYAFATLRPVVYFLPDAEENNNKFNYDKLGYDVNSIKKLINRVKKIISGDVSQGDKIKTIRKKSFCNLGFSEDYFADTINNIINNKYSDDWIKISLFSKNNQKTDFNKFCIGLKKAGDYGLYNLIVYMWINFNGKFQDKAIKPYYLYSPIKALLKDDYRSHYLYIIDMIFEILRHDITDKYAEKYLVQLWKRVDINSEFGKDIFGRMDLELIYRYRNSKLADRLFKIWFNSKFNRDKFNYLKLEAYSKFVSCSDIYNLNKLEQITKKAYYIFGSGSFVKYLIGYLKYNNMRLPEKIFNCDNKNKSIFGLEIIDIKKKKIEINNPVILGSKIYHKEMKKNFLKNYCFKNNIKFRRIDI